MKLSSLSVLLVFLLSGCGDDSLSLGSNTIGAGSPVLDMQVFQDGKSIRLNSSNNSAETRSIVKLDRKAFFLSLPKYADNDVFQVCIWTDDSIFNEVKIGLKTSEVSFYSPGSGMAAEKSPYSAIYIDDIGHNYLNSPRLVKLDSGRHGISVATFGLDRKNYSVEDIDGPLYAVFFTDQNKNKVIEKGELEYFVFEF